jgi:iron complex outermembrane receptor protein
MPIRRRFAFVGLLTLGGCLSFSADAQQTSAAPAAAAAEAKPSGNILEEIVISAARKRTEDVQSTPLAITALDATLLDKMHVSNLQDVGALAPNLQMERTLSTADAVTIYLRGFGVRSNDPAADPHVSAFIDGVYQPLVSGTLMDMFDVGQVEVLAGPQGTLFGKNALIGAVSIQTAKPTGKFGVNLEADYGSYDHSAVRARVNFPIVEGILAGKVSFAEKSGGDWITNASNGDRQFGGEHIKSGRVSLAFTPTAEFEWDMANSFLVNDSHQNALRNVVGSAGIVPGNGSVDPVTLVPTNQGSVAAQGLAIPSVAIYCGAFYGGACPSYQYGYSQNGLIHSPNSQMFQHSSNISYKFAPVTVTAVLGYINYFLHEFTDVDGTLFPALDAYNDQTRSKQKSAELRVSSNKGGGWDVGGNLDWVLGGYFSNFDYSFDNNLAIFSPTPNVYQKQFGKNKSTAAFLHTIYHFSDEWSATFGVRNSHDRKEHSYLAPGQTAYFDDTPATFTNTSVEAGVQWQFAANRMAYVRFAQGYQAGGFIGFPPAPGLGTNFQPAKNNEFEIGLKSDWLDRRLRVNLTYFYNSLKDLQIQGVIPIPFPPGFLQSTTNAGAAKVQGLEAQLIAVPIDALTLHANLGYLHTKYDEYQSTVCADPNVPAGINADCSRLPFPFAPKVTANVGFDYRLPIGSWGAAVVSSDLNYKSEMYLSDPPFPGSRQGGYGLLSSQISFEEASGKYSLDVYGTNLTDKQYMVEFSDSGGLAISQLDGRPREWGVRIKVNFGN